MRRVFSVALLAMSMAMPAMGEDEQGDNIIGTDAAEGGGFVTELLNRSIEKAMPADDVTESVEYGRKVTKYVTAPKFGGYMIGSYKYSDQQGKHGGDGFGARLIRLYVDGTVLRDFDYRLQLEVNGDPGANKGPHVKDFFVEYKHFKEFKVKFGQFKRCFTFENPYNPWDVGVGDYTQLAKKLAGFTDYSGGEGSVYSNGGRDIGIQVQGDLFPIGSDKHRLVHYQAAVYNGQGINHADANRTKDLIGTVQVQPVKDLYIGVFGWLGNMQYNQITVDRHRWAASAKYEHNGWSARAEYAHHAGYRLADYETVAGEQQLKVAHGNGRADAWYATVGVPVTPWFKCYVKYDAYRDNAANGRLRSIYSIAPNFQLHRNLMFQAQYNHVTDKTASDRHYNEVWGMVYVRF